MALLSVERQTLLGYSVDLGSELQATEYFLVIFDQPTSYVLAEMAQGVPVYADPHPDDPRRLLKQKRPQCLENSNRQHWQIQCDYSSLVNYQPNPLLRPATIEWDYDNAQEPYFIDDASEYGQSKNQAVANTAGEPLNTERDSGTWSATYSKNVPTSFTVAPEINVMQCVNSDSFPFDGNTIAQYAAKISGGHLTPILIENGYPFRTVTYKLKFKNGGWIDALANVGMQQLVNGSRVPIVAPASATNVASNTERPWPLQQNGQAFADPTTLPIKLSFYPYHTMAFTPLFNVAAYTTFGGGTLINSGGQ